MLNISPQLIAGDKWQATYTAEPGLNLVLNLNSTGFKYVAQGVEQSGVYTFTVASALSKDFIPATYSLAVCSTLDGERTTLEFGKTVEVLPDPSQASHLSYAQRMLDAIKALLENRITSKQALYSSLTFEGRALAQISPSELMTLKQRYEQEVEQERYAEKLRTKQRISNKLKIAFRKPR